MIYLDNSATTRAFDSVASVVQEALTQNYFNASSPYKKALDTEKAIESKNGCRRFKLPAGGVAFYLRRNRK